MRLADGSFPNATIGSFPYAVFRATRISPDHPGLAGRKLEPLDPQPPWAPPPAPAPVAAPPTPPPPEPVTPVTGDIPIDAKVRRPAPPPDGADLT